MPEMIKRLRVLLLSGGEPETGILKETLARHVVLTIARNVQEMLGLLKAGSYDALLCDWNFQGGSWQDAFQEMRQRYPELPTIVVCRMCRSGGEQEWVEVLEAGCFDIVCAPYCECSVLSVLEHAVASREARRLRSVA